LRANTKLSYVWGLGWKREAVIALIKKRIKSSILCCPFCECFDETIHNNPLEEVVGNLENSSHQGGSMHVRCNKFPKLQTNRRTTSGTKERLKSFYLTARRREYLLAALR
jgi:hypothetical protein